MKKNVQLTQEEIILAKRIVSDAVKQIAGKILDMDNHITKEMSISISLMDDMTDLFLTLAAIANDNSTIVQD